MNHVYNLRSKRCSSKILRSIHAARNRFGFRVVHYSVQGDHFHFMVEAANRKSLSRGMQGLTIRIAKALNKVMERKGKGVCRQVSCSDFTDSFRGPGRAVSGVFGAPVNKQAKPDHPLMRATG